MRLIMVMAAATTFLVIVACESGRVSGPEGVAKVPTVLASANLNCHYTPSGDITLAVGAHVFFTPSSVSDCSGAWGVLTPADSSIGFNNTPCTITSIQANAASAFRVYRCSAGSALLNIYTNSSKTTLLQSVGIDRQL